MSRALSALFQDEASKQIQGRIFRLIAVDVSFAGQATTVSGSAQIEVDAPGNYAPGMSISIEGASGIYRVIAVNGSTVTLQSPVDAVVTWGRVMRTFNMVDANHDIWFGGNYYFKFPVKVSDLQVLSDGTVVNSKLTVANVSREIMYYVESEDGLRGRTVRVTTVFEAHLDNTYTWHPDGSLEVLPNIEPHNPAEDFTQERFVIDGYTATELAVEFTLLPAVDLTIVLPRRKYTKGCCYWTYKDPETCGYVGPLVSCEKTLEDCQAHGNARRFGGFPGISNVRRFHL